MIIETKYNKGDRVWVLKAVRQERAECPVCGVLRPHSVVMKPVRTTVDGITIDDDEDGLYIRYWMKNSDYLFAEDEVFPTKRAARESMEEKNVDKG